MGERKGMVSDCDQRVLAALVERDGGGVELVEALGGRGSGEERGGMMRVLLRVLPLVLLLMLMLREGGPGEGGCDRGDRAARGGVRRGPSPRRCPHSAGGGRGRRQPRAGVMRGLTAARGTLAWRSFGSRIEGTPPSRLQSAAVAVAAGTAGAVGADVGGAEGQAACMPWTRGCRRKRSRPGPPPCSRGQSLTPRRGAPHHGEHHNQNSLLR